MPLDITQSTTVDTIAEEYNGLVPPVGHNDVGKVLFKILAEIIEDKSNKGLPTKWNRHYELARNKHWKVDNPKVSLVTANMLFAHRQRTVNLLTDNNPTFDVTRIGMSDTMEYDILVKACEYWWNETEQQHILEKSIIQGETYGCTIEKVSYYPGEIAIDENGEYVLLNVGAEQGGEVEVTLIDPYYFGMYPLDIDDIQKASLVVHYRPMPLWEARLRWPEFKKKIRPDDEWIDEINDTRKELVHGSGFGGGYLAKVASAVKTLVGYAGKAPGRHEDKSVLIAEFWVKDYTIDPDTKEAKYPGCIRCITVCNGGELVLEDKPNPSINPLLPKELAQQTYLWDKFPFSLTPSITDPNNIWGMSDYEQLEKLQMEVNKTISQITYFKDKASRLKIINPQTSGVSNSEFSNAASVINPSNEVVANAIRYMSPPEAPQDLINVLSLYKDLFATVAGHFELEQAQAQGKDVIAYKAIAALIERAATMMRGKIRNYSRMIRQRGRMYVALAQNWYTEQRLIPVEYDGEIVTQSITGKDLILPGKITVVTGSTMPVSRVQQREETLEVFNRGGCDAEELLKRLNWSNYKEVLKRMSQGPLHELKTKLEKAGVWPEIMQWLDAIESTKPKELERLIESGEIIPFPNLVFRLLDSQQSELGQDARQQESQSKAQLMQAQAFYNQQRAKLIEEQIITERVKQYVMLGGMTFDEEKLKTDRAKIVHEMEMGNLKNRGGSPLEVRKEPGQAIRGIASDNRNRLGGMP